jgi:predicted dehydrogenase
LKILLVGAGSIAPEYVKALKAIGIKNIDVFSRLRSSAEKLVASQSISKAFGADKIELETIVSGYDGVIIASSIESLLPILRQCLKVAPDVPILIEKPVALSGEQLLNLCKEYPQNRVMVALNRLYFPSIALVRARLVEETPTSAAFSFTEWIHRIDASAYSVRELARWGLSNCIHVTSTVFDLIGLPASISTYRTGAGSTEWHPNASVFAGAGVSTQNVPFSYLSDWKSAGRWSIAIHTGAGRYDLQPMEGVLFTKTGTTQALPLLPDYAGQAKCGFSEMLEQWLNPRPDIPSTSLPRMAAYIAATEQIFGYAAEV